MMLQELYDLLKSQINNNTLIISSSTASGTYSRLLEIISSDDVTISSCTITMNAENVIISGRANITPYTTISSSKDGGSIIIINSMDTNEHICYNITLSIAGSGTLGRFCGTLPPSYDENIRADCLFSDFIIYNPVLEKNFLPDDYHYSFNISGFASCSDSDERWTNYKLFLADKMPFSGTINSSFAINPVCNLDFIINKQLPFPLGDAAANLAMRIVDGETTMSDYSVTKAFLLYDVKLKQSDQTARFQSELFTKSTYQSSAAFFSPPLSLGNIAEFMQSLFGFGGNRLLLPDDTLLSSFGLSELQLTLSKKENSLFGGFSIERIYSIFSLANPISTAIPNLALDKFQMVWEASWWGSPDVIVSLFAVARATLKIGSYNLIGEVTGYFPMMEFTGDIALEKELTLTEISTQYGVIVPSEWSGDAKQIASLHVFSSSLTRTMEISASVSDLINITIGSLNLKLTNLQVDIHIAPNTFDFGIQGIIAFTPSGYDPFAFEMSAQYNSENWIFSGKLQSGKVNIGSLLSSLLSIESDQRAAAVELDGFDILYSVNEKHFKLFASFSSSWFTVFGITPTLGGKIMLDKTQDVLDVSAAFYIDIDIFKFLVQANNFYSDEKRTFIFRLEFKNKYVQAVYQKKLDDEFITITLGGLTFGDIIAELIHLINPNAKHSLSSPWNILDKINLSDFSLIINVTKKSAALLYHVNLNLVGLMQVDDIGLSYSKDSGIKYILTGRLLDKTYTADSPLSWDAINASPPINSAADESKLSLFYLGIGNHLDLKITKETIPDILSEVINQLTPTSDIPTVKYQEHSGWLFGIDFELSDMFRIKVILYSPKLYGAIITIAASEKSPLAMFNGLLLELYYKKISSSTGMFHCRLVVPKQFADINLGAIAIHIGQLLLEVYTNGSFYIDLGFPHNNDFSNSFGLSFGIFGGKGGIYFGILLGDAVNSVPAITNGAFTPVIKIGVGLSIGISRSFDFGIIKGGVSLTLIGIFEGTFAIFRPADKTCDESFYYKASTVVGISGSVFLSVDFKIIAISASASINALCELEIESFKESHITLMLDLKLSASIKILFFKIEFSFHFKHKASFSFGNDSPTPWQLQNQNANANRMLAYPPIQINTDISFGSWSIAPVISPMFSVLNPNEAVFDYCIAFPLIINHSDMYSISELLLKWVLSHVSGEFVSSEAALEIKNADFSSALGYADLIKLLSLNLTVSPKFMFQKTNDEIDEGFIFPMLPQLTMQVNDEKINFSENFINESDMKLISEYFYQLNADPMYSFSKDCKDSNESIPICAAILTDWFKMALSELTGNIDTLFSSLTIDTNLLVDIIVNYKVNPHNILLDNPDAVINISALPEYEYNVLDGDSLNSIQAKFSLSYNKLWNAVSDLPLLKTSTEIFYNGYSFNNKSAKLTVLQAAAMFFVRLYSFDEVYTPYAEFILNNNSVDMDWECSYMTEFTLTLPYGKYISLVGDTVVRIAKMLCLINNIYAQSDWLDFKSAFISENGSSPSSVLDSYKIPAPQTAPYYIVSGYTNCASLFRMCYPDLSTDYSNCKLWDLEILKPLSTITFRNITVSDSGKISDMSMKYGGKSIAKAVSQGTATLASSTAIIISKPCEISKAELCEHIIKNENISKIGAILSRGFFQGARPPAPSTKIETPLYELLKLQINNIKQDIDYTFSIENNDNTAAWIVTPTDAAILTATQIVAMLPTGDLNKPDPPRIINPLHSQPKCWSLSSNEEIINSSCNGKIITLPKNCIEYISLYDSLPNLQNKDKIIDNFDWSCIIPIEVMRKSDNVYYLYGAAADNRNLLRSLSLADINKCELLYSPSKLDSKSSGFASIGYKNCKIIKTKLSKETHYGLASNRAAVNPYIASIADTNHFLTLLWECSVIGGGFWLYHDGAALNCFDDDGRATFQIVAVLDKQNIENKAVNSLIISDYSEGLLLSGSKESFFTPVLPIGCVGLKSSRFFDENNNMEGLYQLLGYSLYSDAVCSNIESSSILPVSVGLDRLDYNIAIPLWKLSNQQNKLGQYSAVGTTYDVSFNLRDVLGNQAPLSKVQVKGEYNDNLIALHELPCTKLNYLFVSTDSEVFIKIILSYCNSQSNSIYSDTIDYANEQSAKINTAKTAMYQLRCLDIALVEENSICKESVAISQNIVNQVSAYAEKLYNNLVNAAYESIPAVEILIPVSLATLSTEIVPLCVYLIIKRKEAQSASPQICYAKSAVLACGDLDKFNDEFNRAFPQQRLAFNQSDEMFFVPINVIADTIDIRPYEFRNGGKTFKSPEFVSLKPLSNVLITKDVNVTSFSGKTSAQSFINIDANIWEKRFLSDIESLLIGEVVCKASNSCQADVETMVNAKKNLSKALAARLIPIRKNSVDIPLFKVAKFAEDRFNTDLNLAYNTGSIAVYRSTYGLSKTTSLEPHIDSSHLLSATKLCSENDIFCLFLSNNNTNLSERLSLNVSFPNIEYNIGETQSGYNYSEWLRFQKPITKDDSIAFIDLTADTKIPFPRKECPTPPSMLNQKFSISNQNFLFWDWSTEIVCNAYEQYTLCFRIDFDNNFLVSIPNGRDCFDILADYHCKRESLLNALEKDEAFVSAYNTIAKLAYEYCECGQLPVKANHIQYSESLAIPIKVNFEFGDDIINYTIIPDANRDRILSQLGAKLATVEHISGKKKGDVISFKLSISHLPLYECRYVTPTAWIIQNDNLFNDSSQEIREDFIFKTEEVSLPKMRISADYINPIVISANDINSLVEKIWQYLQADKNFIYINLSVMYEYAISKNIADVYVSTPVTFIPNASKGKTALNITDWQSKFKPYSSGNNRYTFDFVLYEKNCDYALLHATFIGKVNGLL